jgi:succinate-semialdehyde dehydrogenase/glutarate-semialdehyde dehydrogenase
MSPVVEARPFRAVNPATGELLREEPEHSDAEVRERLEGARAAVAAARDRPVPDRCEPLRRIAERLRVEKTRWARLMTEEMGKPIAQGEAEAEKCAAVCEWYAEHAPGLLAPERRDAGAPEAWVRWDPLGPILAIMPWNFPFWQVFRFAAPALAAGNAVLLKHAPNVPGCALALEEIFRDAATPDGIFANLFVGESRVDAIVDDPRVAGVTLTGSERAGRSVAAAAGRSLKKVVLELGGSDPFVVLEDADLARAVETAVTARTINSGQTCIAAKRFVVHRRHAEEFTSELARRMEALKVGDPLDPATQIGPLAREDLRDALHRQVRESVAAGARRVCGGEPAPGPGWWYRPTVLADVRPGMPAADEETFGPVAAVLAADDDEDAIRLANETPYGLGASLWTADAERGRRLAARIEAGCVFVNDFVKSDPRLPFGGVKRSGHGRELGREGIRELVNAKTVVVAPGP